LVQVVHYCELVIEVSGSSTVSKLNSFAETSRWSNHLSTRGFISFTTGRYIPRPYTILGLKFIFGFLSFKFHFLLGRLELINRPNSDVLIVLCCKNYVRTIGPEAKTRDHLRALNLISGWPSFTASCSFPVMGSIRSAIPKPVLPSWF